MNLGYERTITSAGKFAIKLSNNVATGNISLMNRFETCLLSNTKTFVLNGAATVNNFAGDAFKYLGSVNSLNTKENISASLSISVDKTIKAIKDDEYDGMPDNEKIKTATIKNIYEDSNGIVNADIEIDPIEKELYSDLVLRLPITRRI